jgi:hypothetical protein
MHGSSAYPPGYSYGHAPIFQVLSREKVAVNSSRLLHLKSRDAFSFGVFEYQMSNFYNIDALYSCYLESYLGVELRQNLTKVGCSTCSYKRVTDIHIISVLASTLAVNYLHLVLID